MYFVYILYISERSISDISIYILTVSNFEKSTCRIHKECQVERSFVCMYVSIYIAHYRMELNPDLMTLFRFQFGRCDWTHHRMFNVISLKAIKDPCVMRAAFRRRDCYRFLTGSAGFRNQSLIAFFPKRWRSNPLHHYIPKTALSRRNELLTS